MEQKLELWQLQQRQALPLEVKINLTKQKIRQFYEGNEGNVYVAFSGGKDSTVLLDLVRSIYPDVKAVFSNTGLEYPEIVEFVTKKENVVIVRPEKSFKWVWDNKGIPIGSKKIARFIRDLQNPTDKNKATCNLRLTGLNRKGQFLPSMKLSKKWLKLVNSKYKVSEECCEYLKKKPLKNYSKETKTFPIMGIMANESKDRRNDYLTRGCNIFGDNPASRPIAFWTEQDILEYIYTKKIDYCSVYGDIKIVENKVITMDLKGKIEEIKKTYITTGVKRTGCIFCMFGVHLEKQPNRFQQMKLSHPQLWTYCINNLKIGEVLDFIEVPYGKENV